MSAHNWYRRRNKQRRQSKLARTTEKRLKTLHASDWRPKEPVRNDMPRRHSRPSKNKRKANDSREIDPRRVQVRRRTRNRRPPKRPRYIQRKQELANS